MAAAIQAVAAGLTVIIPAPDDGFAREEQEVEDDNEHRPDGGSWLEPLIETLTPRELQILRLLAEGLANRAIATQLTISEHTAKFHVGQILAKLGAESRTEAVTQGLRRGLILL